MVLVMVEAAGQADLGRQFFYAMMKLVKSVPIIALGVNNFEQERLLPTALEREGVLQPDSGDGCNAVRASVSGRGHCK